MLDFFNDAESIEKSFEPFYRTTVLSGETDANKLHDLKGDLDGYQVYDEGQIDLLVTRYLDGEDRDRLDPILDVCVGIYTDQLDEDGQVDFKGKAKAFVRAYGFLSSILPYTHAPWEKLSIFLNFLVPKLPSPKDEDLSKGILEAIDMDSYRVEKQAAMRIQLEDADGEIEPAPVSGGDSRPSRNSTDSPISSRSSTTCSATSRGRMRTESARSSQRTFPGAWRKTRLQECEGPEGP